LSNAGQKEAASAVFARCRELGPATSTLPHPAGLVDFLSLSPAEQRARYRAGVERTVQKDPANVEAQVRYLELLLEDAKAGEARTVAEKIAALNPSAGVTADAARALLGAEQYSALKEFITQTGAASSGELAIDLALADAHIASPQAALEEMDRISPSERNGDYYLALAQILEIAGKNSAGALKQAMPMHPKRPELYRQAASRFIQNHRPQEALEVLDEATRTLPDDADLVLMKDALQDSLH
jgi:tetratricopeptide (TPR) repeat protein